MQATICRRLRLLSQPSWKKWSTAEMGTFCRAPIEACKKVERGLWLLERSFTATAGPSCRGCNQACHVEDKAPEPYLFYNAFHGSTLRLLPSPALKSGKRSISLRSARFTSLCLLLPLPPETRIPLLRIECAKQIENLIFRRS